MHSFLFQPHISLLTITSIEHLTKFKKKQAAVVKKGKSKIGETASETVHAVTKPNETVRTWKREALEGRKRDTEHDDEQPTSDQW